jgi:hypothetical protein
MREIRLSGSEGGGGRRVSPYPYWPSTCYARHAPQALKTIAGAGGFHARRTSGSSTTVSTWCDIRGHRRLDGHLRSFVHNIIGVPSRAVLQLRAAFACVARSRP